MNTAVYCDECGCFSIKISVWYIKDIIVCAHCFLNLTGEIPYLYYNAFECDQIDENEEALRKTDEEFDQILREIDNIRQENFGQNQSISPPNFSLCHHRTITISSLKLCLVISSRFLALSKRMGLSVLPPCKLMNRVSYHTYEYVIPFKKLCI